MTPPPLPIPREVPDPPAAPEWLAAVDLGSNSFHMIVARVEDGRVRIVDRMRETVRLAMGLDGKKRLSRDAQQRAAAALARFGERVRHFEPGTVRAVGTNTLRRAKKTRAFLRECRELLGHEVEVISGHEEARLIYLGVAHDVEPPRGRRVVVDIGGGSTEIILGEGPKILSADSLYMGCVSYSRRYFGKGRIRRKSMEKAITAARLELEPIKSALRRSKWEHALGASGTIRAVARFARVHGYCRTGITAEGVAQVKGALIEAGGADQLSTESVSAERRTVFAGGVAILAAVFKDLRIDRMQVADGALREGVLYDLLGRLRQDDVRDETVERMMQRYGVDRGQAARVETTSLDLLEQVFADWHLPGGDARSMLAWASRLHEVGISVAHSGYHKHGAYLLSHSDMSGFSRGDQLELSTLVRSHRRKLRDQDFDPLPPERRESALRLAVLLRLAVRLRRSRNPEPMPGIRVTARGNDLRLTLPSGWLDENPMTRADLEVEAARLGNAGIRLEFA